MLPRVAACLLAVGLIGSVATAGSFASPPPAEAVAPVEPAIRIADPPVAPSRAEVRDALARRRAKNLASFRAYRKAGVYPHNDVRFGPLNIWIDSQGHLCAAATMIDRDGKHELVLETSRSNNQIRLLNVTKGPLLDWILTSGFTIEEIDRIQAPMIEPEGEFPSIRMPDYAAEDARLAKKYAATDAALVKAAKRSLDKAVERLMRNPALAAQLIASDTDRVARDLVHPPHAM